MRCAVFRHENGRHCRELSEACIVKTVVVVTKTVVAVMKTIVMPIKGQIPFEYSGRYRLSFATDDSPEVLLFHNVRIFYFLVTKEFRFSISCRSRFINCLLVLI